MWQVYCDGNLIYSPASLQSDLTNPKLSLEINKAGRFTFTIYPSHPHYDYFYKHKSIITVFNSSEVFFRGRIVDEMRGWNNQKNLSCESDLAFLNDTIQRPFSFPSDSDHATPADYFAFLIGRHNEQVEENKRFIVGDCTVTDPNNYIARSDSEYSTTWALLKEGLVDSLGGYVVLRHETAGTYIDYLADLTSLGNQPIQFAENLIDLGVQQNGADVATAIIPLGAADENEERTTISGLPDEDTEDFCKVDDYVYSKAAETQYGGRITKVVVWDSVYEPQNLKSKAISYLADARKQTQTTEIKAVDLSAAGYDYNTFRVGDYVYTDSPPHDITGYYLVTKLSIDMQQPANNRLTIGEIVKTFTGNTYKQLNIMLKDVKTNVSQTAESTVQNLMRYTTSQIEQSESRISNKVSETYYSKRDAGELEKIVGDIGEVVQENHTEFLQTAEEFEMTFAKQSIVDGRFENFEEYIRFEGGDIILGEQGNTLTCRIENDRISFRQDDVQVAYFTNHKFYVTDAEFSVSAKIGKFAFVPGAAGNLSFKKVGD